MLELLIIRHLKSLTVEALLNVGQARVNSKHSTFD